jgi:hypothetical protein
MWQHAVSRIVPKAALYGRLSEQKAAYLPKVKVKVNLSHYRPGQTSRVP